MYKRGMILRRSDIKGLYIIKYVDQDGVHLHSSLFGGVFYTLNFPLQELYLIVSEGFCEV
jgi:hypothetical protein